MKQMHLLWYCGFKYCYSLSLTHYIIQFEEDKPYNYFLLNIKATYISHIIAQILQDFLSRSAYFRLIICECLRNCLRIMHCSLIPIFNFPLGCVRINCDIIMTEGVISIFFSIRTLAKRVI